MEIKWASAAAVRLVLPLILGILLYLYAGQMLPDLRWWVAGLAALYLIGQLWAARQPTPGATDAAGLLAVLTLGVAGAALTQQATESRNANHLYQFGNRVEYYRAVVDDYTVVRPATYATTVRVSAVRVAGRWRPALGGIRVSIPREEGLTAPHYGDVWIVRGTPAPSKAPLNPGEFDYRRYLQYHQVYHQQFIHPDQYLQVATRPPSLLRAAAMRAARVLDGVFRQYVHAKREYALASALVLGIKDEVDQETKQAYANTGTTHIMAVSGLQVGLLFGAVTWLLGRVPGRRGPWFRLVTALLGLGVIWSYAFLTGLSASVLRAAVMFSFLIVGRATSRQISMYNLLAVAAFCLLCYDPYLLCDVGFQLSFLAVLSIVYLQPRIVSWWNPKAQFLNKQRPWQSKPVQKSWQWLGVFLQYVWSATALSLAAQVATFPLGLYYFHQFPLSFLASNLIAVPISSIAVYVGLGLLTLKGVVTLVGVVLPGVARVLDYGPQSVAYVFEMLIRWFNQYIFWIGRVMPGALISGIHVTTLQVWLIGTVLLLLLVFFARKQLTWLALACTLVGVFAGSRVWAAYQLAPTQELIIYSIPRRSVVGFWQGAAAEIVTVDSLPLTETERTYRIVPGSIRRDARRVSYRPGWQACPVPAVVAEPGLTLAAWQNRKLAFVSGPLSAATAPVPGLTAVVLRRNARVQPGQLAAVFGTSAPVVFDSSCKSWYVLRQDSLLRSAGFRTHDVTLQGAFVVSWGR
ncbi:ComEC/Rec2 family competence protein [Hymenobacter endophyticus]|uniref:ComEC/Rec2 family competence protein n=1 Tax=Hymenobacter endophyticus TaxID=3076335 RepID=A0ABU3TIX9_9BACT|nr:ComEC/Rec2 family competence protein [Hymenobacter endophyticus]MDU0371334.1 ComEC/Rec2 family competence protein [Hymenobacter endophyticus]